MASWPGAIITLALKVLINKHKSYYSTTYLCVYLKKNVCRLGKSGAYNNDTRECIPIRVFHSRE